MKRTIKFLIAGIASTGSVTLPLVALAQGNPFQTAQSNVTAVGTAAGVQNASVDLPTVIGNVINIVLGFLGILLLLFILYAGFLWMTAGGDEAKVKKATDYIRNAIIGLVIIILAFAISNFVLTQLIKVTGQG
ncbi:MAG: hypothetical protein WC477_04045 [Patescibacteria group bacterium]